MWWSSAGVGELGEPALIPPPSGGDGHKPHANKSQPFASHRPGFFNLSTTDILWGEGCPLHCGLFGSIFLEHSILFTRIKKDILLILSHLKIIFFTYMMNGLLPVFLFNTGICLIYQRVLFLRKYDGFFLSFHLLSLK